MHGLFDYIIITLSPRCVSEHLLIPPPLSSPLRFVSSLSHAWVIRLHHHNIVSPKFICQNISVRLASEALPAPRRNVRSTPDGGAAVQPPGLSYTAHWEALGSALCLLTTRAISRTGPVCGRGPGPGSSRPRARVALVVWAWDLSVLRLLCCGLPAPACLLFFALRFVTVCHSTDVSP
jgi:hypothetical protein